MPDGPSPAPPAGDEQALFDWLATHDAPCPVCSYNLRALREPRCPECAARLFLAVGTEDMAIGPWLLAVVALAMAMGFDTVVALIMTVGLVLERPSSPADLRDVLLLLATFAFGAGACGAMLLRLVRRRRHWRRSERRRQWRTACTVFVTVAAAHAVFGLWVVSRF
jgi:hypothetical protein